MKYTNADEPSMPIQYEEEYGDKGHKFTKVFEGLTKREHFAAMCLQGLISKYNLSTPEDQITISKVAIEVADTFINQLNQ